MERKPGAEDETDERLLERVSARDHAAFSVLVRRHTSRFYAAAFRICANTQDSEDIVQDAFLKIWNDPQLWDKNKGAKFTTWFYRVVTNLTIDRMRRRKKHVHPDALAFVADSSPGHDTALQEKDERDGLEAAIQSLPERQKLALNLCFYEGLSNREAAEIMGVRLKALESLLMRAKAGVREDLIRRGLMEDDMQEKRYAG